MSDDLDAATLAAYRREIERAAGDIPATRAAVTAIFAALDRRDNREKAMLEIVQAVARMRVGGCISPEHVAAACALLADR